MYSIITATQLSGNSPKLGFDSCDDEIENRIPINSAERVAGIGL
ncbi:hypothetical protein A2U01_0047645, partial [Trifolium medium]|nr:hypothetical protein [Trifolium medium]